MRRDRWYRTISLDDTPELSSDELDLEARYIAEEQKQTVHRAMSRLSAEYRQILWLIYFEELSNKEAAQIMKKSVHAVETLVYRARKALKKQLETEGFDYENI